MIRVSIYEDNEFLRKSLSHLVQGTTSMTLAGSYTNADNVIADCLSSMPEVILMDIDMPGTNGIEATAQVKKQFPGVNILIFTVFNDRQKVFDAICAGATGYLLKKANTIQIIEAITELYNGGSPMTADILKPLPERRRERNENS